MDTPTRLFGYWRKAVSFLSGEWILTKYRIPNGGAAVLFRAVFTSMIVFILVLAFLNLVDPSKTWDPSLTAFQSEIVNKFPWFGAIFAATYTGFYARFASQWSYLANLYNDIKQTEAAEHDKDVAAWKAGFLEDADNLHMAGKGTFVSILKAWGANDEVKKCFIDNTPGGEVRFQRLMEKVQGSYEIVDEKYRST